MSKKIRALLSVLLLTTFMAAYLNIAEAKLVRAYSSATFQSYRVIITTSKLNIRKTPSETASIVGYYLKGQIVDITGQSGSFLKTAKGYIWAAYTQKYNTQPAASRGAQTFTPYKAQVTTTRLNIRKGPSTSYAIVGYYLKGNIIDIIGQSGSFLKTSKGYVAAEYTKKYTAPGSSVSSFQSYKAEVTTSKLNIRKGPSTSYAIVGYYTINSIIDIIGQSGTFLKTSKGYVAAEYTKRYVSPSRGDTPSTENDGKYVLVNQDMPLLLSIDGTSDERYAVRGKKFKILSQAGDYFKVKMGKVYGYLPTANLTILDKPVTDKIALAWQYVYTRSSNPGYYNDDSDHIRKNSADLGLDVVSPTWFYMTGDAKNPSTINVAEKADREYTRTAHRNGYEVWACFQEFNTDRAYQIFYNSSVKERVIKQTVDLAIKYELDGVNIDFEGLGGNSQNKDGLTAFVRDLSAALKNAGITVSIDITKPVLYSVYSNFYDRPALANYVDYMIYMAYDEHYASSKSAGSVGSYPWVESGLKGIIDQGVPKEKIILGVPFYLRDFTMLDTVVPYDSVVFERASALYRTPVDQDPNKIVDLNSGYALKYLETVDSWYKVDYNGTTGYISQKNSLMIPENTSSKTLEPNVDMILPYDSIVFKNDGAIYSQAVENEGFKIALAKTSYAFKYLETLQDWYKVEYNGVEAYIPQRDSIYVYADGVREEGEAATNFILPYASVMLKADDILRKQPIEANDNILLNVSAGGSYKYISTLSIDSNWYVVDYNGTQAYARKSDTFYVSANTKRSSVIKSSAISMKTAYEKITQYSGRIYYDSTAKQNVGEYSVGGYRHLVWLEDKESMAWRMDLINSYDLAGTGAWSLNWAVTDDVWMVIKEKLKH